MATVGVKYKYNSFHKKYTILISKTNKPNHTRQAVSTMTVREPKLRENDKLVQQITNIVTSYRHGTLQSAMQ